MKFMVIGFGSFLLFAFLFFVILKVSQPEKAAVENASTKGGKTNTKYVKNLEKKIKKLQEDLNKSSSDFEINDLKIDSLSSLLAQQTLQLEEKEKQIGKLNEELEQSKNEEKNASDLAKTFSSMKTDEMRPILKNIDDNTVKMIYKNINNRMKKNFLLALTPQRAASLTKQLAVAQ